LAAGRTIDQIGELLRAQAFSRTGAAQHNRHPAHTIGDHAGPHAFNLRAHHVLQIGYRHPDPACGDAVNIDEQIIHPVIGDGHGFAGAVNPLQPRLNRARQPRQLGIVGAEQLDRQIAARAGQHFRRAHFDRLGEGRLDTGELFHHFAQFTQQPFLVLHAPFIARLQLQEAVGFVGAHRIKAQFVRSDAGDHRFDFGHLGKDCTLHFHVASDRMIERNRRQFGQLHNHRAFIEHRQEGLAGHGIGRPRQREADPGDGEHAPFVRKGTVKQRVIARRNLAHQPWFVMMAVRLRLDLEQVERQHRHQRQRQHQCGCQRQHDGERDWRKQLALQPFEREQRQEHDGDDRQPRCHRLGHFG